MKTMKFRIPFRPSCHLILLVCKLTQNMDVCVQEHSPFSERVLIFSHKCILIKVTQWAYGYISRFDIKTFRHDPVRNQNYANIFQIFTEIQIESRRIERVGRSKLIQMNLTEPDVELFMNLTH